DLAARRLAPDGLFCQWLQLYETTADDFSAILRSFAAVFPEVHVFRVDTDAILVGAKVGSRVRLDALLARRPGRCAETPPLAPDDRRARYWEGESLYSLGERRAAYPLLAALRPTAPAA